MIIDIDYDNNHKEHEEESESTTLCPLIRLFVLPLLNNK